MPPANNPSERGREPLKLNLLSYARSHRSLQKLFRFGCTGPAKPDDPSRRNRQPPSALLGWSVMSWSGSEEPFFQHAERAMATPARGSAVKEGAVSPNSHADRTGTLIAAVCFVHCIAGPMLLSLAGFASLIGISEKLEPAFLLGSLAMGVAALIPGYRRHHRRRSCLAMFCTGMICLLLRHHIPSDLPAESIGTCIGASLIAGADILNHRLSRRCRCCESVAKSDSIGTHLTAFNRIGP